MKWHWKLRISDHVGNYAIGQVITERDLGEIQIIERFYQSLTGGRILLEGMSETPYPGLTSIETAFGHLYVNRNRTPI